MAIYIGLLIYLFLMAFIVKNIVKARKKQEKIILFLGLLAMYLLCALRSYDLGADTPAYLRVYLEAGKHGWLDFDWVYFESGYIFLMKLCTQLGFSFTGFLIVAYAIVYIPLYFFLKRYSKDALFSLLIYVCYTFFTFNLTGIRNSISISICLLAYMALNKKSWKAFLKYALLILFATLFHKSAFIFFVTALFFFFPFNKKTAIFYIIVSLLLIFNKEILVQVAHDFLGKSSVELQEITIGGSTILFVLIFVLSMLMIFYRNSLIKERKQQGIYSSTLKEFTLEKERTSFMHFLYIAMLSFFLVGTSGTLIRAAMYFQIFIIVALPSVFEMFDQKSRTILKLIAGILLIIFYYFTVLNVNTYNTVPYQFFWQ